MQPDSPPTTEGGIVGKSPEYEPIRRAAQELVAEWVPWGLPNSDRWWGAGFCGVVHEEAGEDRVFVETYGWEKRGLGHNKVVPLDMIRAAAISLLVYCEAHDPLEDSS